MRFILPGCIGVLLLSGSVMAKQGLFEAQVDRSRDASAPASTKTNTIPDDEHQARTRRLLHNIFARDYDDTTQAGKQALAQKLLKRTLGINFTPGDKYVMLCEARNLSIDAGDLATALEIVDKLANGWPMDLRTMQMELLLMAGSKAGPRGSTVLAPIALKMLPDLVAEENYEALEKLLPVMQNIASQADDATLAKQADRAAIAIKSLVSQYKQVKPSFEKLQSDANDPAANLAVGWFYVVARDEWKKGLGYLGKGSDSAVAALAKSDQANPTEAEEQARLADGWWSFAEKQKEPLAQKVHDHASIWYRRALPGLKGIRASMAAKRAGDVHDPAATDPKKTTNGGTELKLPKPPSTFGAIAAAIADKKYEKSKEVAGRPDPASLMFLDLPRNGAYLTGLVVGLEKSGKTFIVKSVKPIYVSEHGRITGELHGVPGNQDMPVEAKEDYVIGKIAFGGYGQIEGIRLTFYRMRDGVLDMKDKYDSPVIGRIAKASTTCGGSGKPIIGLHGSVHGQLNTVGVIEKK